MKLLYIISALFATATIAYTQILAAIAVIGFVIELTEVETGAAMLIEISTDIDISSEVVEGEMVFSAETNSALGYKSVESQMIAFDAQVVMDDIDPVLLNVGNEPFFADIRWIQDVEAFGQNIPVLFTTGITTDVVVNREGAMIFKVNGEIAYDGFSIRLDNPGFTTQWLQAKAGIIFVAPDLV